MSLDQFLNQTCVIDRPTGNGVDRYNQNQYDKTRVGSNVRCRLIEKDIRMLDEKSAEYTWVQVTLLILPSNAIVQVKDEVSLDGVKYLVKKPLERKRANALHHVSVVVEALNV